MDSENVLGHYSLLANGTLQPLLAESSPLFRSLHNDDVQAVARLLLDDPASSRAVYNVLYWASQAEEQVAAGEAAGEDGASHQPGPAPRPVVSVKQRTLLMIAAHRAAITGSKAVLSLLLKAGADPRQSVPDGLNCYTMVQQAGGEHEADVLALLQAAADLLPPAASANGTAGGAAPATNGGPNVATGATTTSGSGRLDPLFPATLGAPDRDASGAYSEPSTMVAPSNASDQGSAAPGFQLAVDLQHHLQLHPEGEVVDPYHAEGLPYSTSELTQPEYCTDEFRMFAFKVLRCSKRFAHDWRACPFSHPTENARRRDPRSFRYCALACPDYKQGFCVRGDLCPYAHGVFEAWLHPSRYRTQLCKDGANCHRPICFFAHSLPELRTPTYTWTPGGGDGEAVPPPGTPPPAASEALAAKAVAAGGSAAQNALLASESKSLDGGGGRGVDPGMAAAAAAGAMPPPAPGPAAAAMFGFTAPRMSNAFARRHGLNPKDNAMLNLQKIALQTQPGSQMNDHLGRLLHGWLGNGAPAPSHIPHPHAAGLPDFGGVAPGGGGPYSAGPRGGPGAGMNGASTGRGKAGVGVGLYGMGPGQPAGGPQGGPLMMPPGGYPGHGYPALMGMPGMGGAGGAHDPSGLAALNHHLATLSLHNGAAAAAAAAYATGQAAGGMGMGGFGGGMPNGNGYGLGPHPDSAVASSGR